MSRQLHLRKAAATAESSATVNFDIFSFLGVLFRHRRWLVGATLSAAVLAALISLLIPNKYTAVTTVLPSKGGDKLSALTGITGISALDFMGGSGVDVNSSELFPTILSSRRVKDTALTRNYQFVHDGERMSMTLLEYLEEDNLDKARKDLGKVVSVASEFKTGVITLSVTTRYPEFSAAIAETFLEELDKFNRKRRKTSASVYEEYMASLVADAEEKLQKIEDEYSSFQAANRGWATSSDPQLQKETFRLRRNLEVKVKTFALITQRYELARSETQKDLPVVQTLDPPGAPLMKSAPRRSFIVILSALAAAIFGMGFVFLREALVNGAQGSDRQSYLKLRGDFQDTYPRINQRLERWLEKSQKSQKRSTPAEIPQRETAGKL